jgi:hypothetical protein
VYNDIGHLLPALVNLGKGSYLWHHYGDLVHGGKGRVEVPGPLKEEEIEGDTRVIERHTVHIRVSVMTKEKNGEDAKWRRN